MLAESGPSLDHEREAMRRGYCRVAGVDEVGRGCLFGPVVAAAVVLDPARAIEGLQDSKAIPAGLREELNAIIRERALAVSIASVDNVQIDRLNIYQATRRAMRQAVSGLVLAADYLLVDAMKIDTPLPQESLIKGDARSCSIAAASIVAKVERDRWLLDWDAQYPGYGLASNKGYATAGHRRALVELGPTPLHRFSFRPVAEAAGVPLASGAATLPLFSEIPVGTGRETAV